MVLPTGSIGRTRPWDRHLDRKANGESVRLRQC